MQRDTRLGYASTYHDEFLIEELAHGTLDIFSQLSRVGNHCLLSYLVTTHAWAAAFPHC